MNPSVLIIPDRYKAAKLYSQIPESGDGDFLVTRSTTATRVNASGLIESVASDVPRLDYRGGGCPSLLVEPAATNLFLRSEEFDNAYWSKSGIAVSGDTSTAPNSTLTADEIIEDAGASTSHRLSRGSLSFTSGTVYSVSAFVKRGVGTRNCQLGLTGAGVSFVRVYFDLTNGTVGQQTNGTGTIESLSNGWFRITATGTAANTVASGFVFLANTNGTTTDAEVYSGDGVSSILWWGAQLETGSVATSYIPTVASTVTRNADVISLSSASGLIGQSEGTIYAEVDLRAQSYNSFRGVLYVGVDGNNFVEIGLQTNGMLYARLAALGVGVGTTYSSLFNSGTAKIAIAYSQSTLAVALNGIIVLSQSISSFSFASPLDKVELGTRIQGGAARVMNDRISAAAIYTTRLSNAELASLTTL